ncbi:uncharacterized protein PV09_03780 [Verruconis gallopava]|uniref:Survival Motor Neuron Gemin2-binding domain-containing protein n=1 Tax=Verruconis gallopava TaxID=253628 RepID=A0A0D2B1M3_9PEZI|nr:uncharacterized protein PV09_03780 [Verruconis gallopava]KIW05244.1 hypothetical protein PV09_03780 [Verruconis gallopava]
MDLNDASAWDDSELINTWDEALEEYKRYHSIHLSGKRLDEVLSKEEWEQVLAQRRALRKGAHNRTVRHDQDGDAQSNIDVDENEKDMSMSPERDIPIEVAIKQQEPVPQHDGDSPSRAQAQPDAPTGSLHSSSTSHVPLLLGVQDENLKNLLMAWYYAGYHTGLYEGRQQAMKELSKESSKA